MRLNPDCIKIRNLDFREDTIHIEIDGFEKIHLELLGVNTDLEIDSMLEDNSISKMNSYRNGEGTTDNIRCDLMSVGIIVYMLLVGLAPF